MLARDAEWSEGLHIDQARTLLLARLGQNMVINGPAGAGKSFLVQKIILLHSQGAVLKFYPGIREVGERKFATREGTWEVLFSANPDSKTVQADNRSRILVGAYAAQAALALGGGTLHSVFGMVPGSEYESAKKMSAFIRKRLKMSNLVIIDEISMVNPQFAQHIHERGCYARDRTHPDLEPFMGRSQYRGQAIVLGDWSQNAPIINDEDKDRTPLLKASKWLFDHPRYMEWFPVQVQLTKVFRQTDRIFVDILSRIRTNTATDADLNVINAQVLRAATTDDSVAHMPEELRKAGIVPVRLYAKNKDVDIHNHRKLSELKGTAVQLGVSMLWVEYSDEELEWRDAEPKRKLHAVKKPPTKIIDKHIKNLQPSFPSALKLRIGAQVRCTVNQHPDPATGLQLVNGSMGKVVGWQMLPMWRILNCERTLAADLELEEDNADAVDESNNFARVPSIQALRSRGEYGGAVVAGAKRKKQAGWDDIFPVPVIEWEQPGGGLMKDIMMPRITFRAISASAKEGYMAIVGWPLQLAWALTIHRAQGATFSATIVKTPARMWDPALLYVALSRVRTLEGLTLLSPITRQHLRADKDVLRFYASIAGRGAVYVHEDGVDAKQPSVAEVYMAGHDELMGDFGEGGGGDEDEEEKLKSPSAPVVIPRQGRFAGDRVTREGVRMKWKEEEEGEGTSARWTQSSSESQ